MERSTYFASFSQLMNQMIQQLASYSVRAMLLGYFALLSALLLVSDPFALLGMPRPPAGSGGYAHFQAFTLLGLLVAACRFKLQIRWIYLTTLLYAVLIELLQFTNPARQVDPVDMLQNVLGASVGMLAWMTIECVYRNMKSSSTPEEPEKQAEKR